MQKINYGVLSLCLTLTFIQCKPLVNNELIGVWQLTHEQIDFGADANQEVAVTSKKTVEFKADGTVVSNGQLCAVTPETTTPSAGKYDSSSKTISIVPCGPGLGATKYEQDAKDLKIYFVCNAVCFQRYKKIK